MRTCDVLIVGGGPGGSTCARALKRAGADVVVLDRARFPRDKVCAGWVTPLALSMLHLSPDEYRESGGIIQELHGFETSVIGGSPLETDYGRAVSYAIRRCEFDAFLLRRSGARVQEGTDVRTIDRTGTVWTVNGEWRAPVIVGAGGHFCPVARRLRPHVSRGLVVAREVELPLKAPAKCPVAGEVPQLFFSRDLEGYGWCVRKGDFLNVGIGRRLRGDFDAHARGFAQWLGETGRISEAPPDPRRWRGHAYLLAGAVARPPIDDGIVLVGDAAGLAAPESGEGIGPAIESGIAASRALVGARGRYTAADLQPYADAVRAMAPADSLSRRVRAGIPPAIGRWFLTSPRFTRRVLNQWFLRFPAEPPSASREAA